MKQKPIEVAAVPYTFGISQAFDGEFDSEWVQFPGHYLLYASSGAFQLEVGNARWLLPPQRAAWVAAAVPLRLTAGRPGTTSSVLFRRDSIPPPAFDCRVFAVSALAREMLLYATRWGREQDPGDAQREAEAEPFFCSLAHVCTGLADHPDHFWLPVAGTPELGLAMEFTLARLAEMPTLAEVAAVAAVSERTLARRFADETGMTWSQFVRRARMIRAMELLADPDMKIIDVVYAVGFASVSAFNHAFRQFTGETPSGYRQQFQSQP